MIKKNNKLADKLSEFSDLRTETVLPKKNKLGTLSDIDSNEDEMFSDDDAHMLSEKDADKLKDELTSKAPEKYDTSECIGKGGMKIILKAKDIDTSRDIALAVMREETGQSKVNTARFIREARITANLEHPNIVPVHDIGIDGNGNPYFTMKLIKGETFANILEELRANNPVYIEKYKLHQLLLIFRKVCNAIAFAHSKGIIHLDLTPDNIQVGRFGEVLVLDWGLAKMIDWHDDEIEEEGNAISGSVEEIKQRIAETPTGITMDGVAKGTPGYMAPEQAAGRNQHKDQRTDIYALGAILYSILTWEVTIENDDIDQVLDDTIDGNILPPKLRAPKRLIPTALEAIAMKALDVNADERYQKVMELRADIDAYLTGRATVAEKAGLTKKTLLFMNRHKLTLAFVTIILILLVTIGRYMLLSDYIEKSNWHLVYDMRTGYVKVDQEFNLVGTDSKMRSRSTDRGIDLFEGEALFLKGVHESRNVMMDVELISSTAPFNIQFYITSNYIEGKKKIFGYVLHFGEESYVEKVAPEGTSVISMSSFVPKVNTPYRITFQKVEGDIAVYVNGATLIYTKDPLPIVGRKLSGVGLKSLSPAITVTDLKVNRIPIFDKVSPLLAGDALIQAGNYEEAISKYLEIANSTQNPLIAQKAFARAFITAKSYLPETSQKAMVLKTINSQIESNFPDFIYSDKL